MATDARAAVPDVTVVLALGLTVGTGLGAVLVASLWRPDVPLWYFWAPLAMGLSISAGTAPATGLGALRRLEELGYGPGAARPRTVTATSAVVLATLLVVNLPWLIPGSDSIAQNGLLISWTVIAGSPMALALLSIRSATRQAGHTLRGDQVEMLLELRRSARSLVLGGGALTALVTVQGGVVMSLVRAIDSDYDRPQQYVLVIGAVGTILVGGLYAVTRASLQRHALELVASLAPLRGTDDPLAIDSALERRSKLLEALEANRSLLGDLQADMIVLAPLLASAAAVILPRSG